MEILGNVGSLLLYTSLWTIKGNKEIKVKKNSNKISAYFLALC